MEVFKSNDENKEEKTFDFLQDGEHLLIGKDEEGRLVVALYYDDINREFGNQESFLINNSNYYIYTLFEKLFEKSKENKIEFPMDNSSLVLTKDERGFRIYFFDHTEEDKNMMEARFDVVNPDSKPIMDMFSKLQEYDPKYHQIHMSELPEVKALKKKKVVERKKNM